MANIENGWSHEPKTEPSARIMVDSKKFSVERSQFKSNGYIVAGVSPSGSVLAFETDDIIRTMGTMADWLGR